MDIVFDVRFDGESGESERPVEGPRPPAPSVSRRLPTMFQVPEEAGPASPGTAPPSRAPPFPAGAGASAVPEVALPVGAEAWPSARAAMLDLIEDTLGSAAGPLAAGQLVGDGAAAGSDVSVPSPIVLHAPLLRVSVAPHLARNYVPPDGVQGVLCAWCETPLLGGSRLGELLDGHYRFDCSGCAAKARADANLSLLDRELGLDVPERHRTRVRLGHCLMLCDVCVWCWRSMWSSSSTSFGAMARSLMGWKPFSQVIISEASGDLCFGFVSQRCLNSLDV